MVRLPGLLGAVSVDDPTASCLARRDPPVVLWGVVGVVAGVSAYAFTHPLPKTPVNPPNPDNQPLS